MAATAKELRYRNGNSIDGSLALDLDRAVRERELRHAGELTRRREAERETSRVRSLGRTAVRERQHISVLSAMGFTALAVMAVLVLMSYIQLTMVSGDTVTLKSELAALQTEQVTLTAQYEQMFDMTSVKETASAAGMAKPSSTQICYLDLAGADTVVIYRAEEPSVLSRLLSGLHHGVYTVVEYFD